MHPAVSNGQAICFPGRVQVAQRLLDTGVGTHSAPAVGIPTIAPISAGAVRSEGSADVTSAVGAHPAPRTCFRTSTLSSPLASVATIAPISVGTVRSDSGANATSAVVTHSASRTCPTTSTLSLPLASVTTTSPTSVTPAALTGDEGIREHWRVEGGRPETRSWGGRGTDRGRHIGATVTAHGAGTDGSDGRYTRQWRGKGANPCIQ
eukprot:gene7271-biopygen6330